MRCPLLILLFLGTELSAAEPSPDTTITVTAPPSIPSAAPQFVSNDVFTSAILNSTNFFRTEHNASWIGWNTTIADFAGSYLESDGDCSFAHSGRPYGEKIALGCSDAASCVDLWGDERADYNYDSPGFAEDTGHFTQLVWKDTTSVGCGRRLCGSSGWFLVCEYWPRGNVIGKFGDQVGRQVNGTASRGTAVRPSAIGVAVLFLVASSWPWLVYTCTMLE